MPYRQTEQVARKLAARHEAILAAACDIATENGMAAVQIAPVAERAAIAAGTVYRYFPSKTHLVAALAEKVAGQEMAAIGRAVRAAPGPLSALAAAITTAAARALARRRLIFALTAEAVEPDIDVARRSYQCALAAELERLIRHALAGAHLPVQDATLAAAAVVGAMTGSLVGPLAVVQSGDGARQRALAQSLCLFVLRALGVLDARARGLVVQAAVPDLGF